MRHVGAGVCRCFEVAASELDCHPCDQHLFVIQLTGLKIFGYRYCRGETMDTKSDTAFDTLMDWVGQRLASKLNKQSSGYNPYTPSDFDTLCRTLLPGDVLLIEGNERVSVAIKYLTQSTWSHAAMFVGGCTSRARKWIRTPKVDRGKFRQWLRGSSFVQVRDLQYAHLPPSWVEFGRT